MKNSELLKKLKIGDKIILKKSNSGASEWNGKQMEVTAFYSGYIQARSLDGFPNTGNMCIYPKDEFCLSSRKEQAKYVKEKIDSLKLEIENLKNEYNMLTKFETDEDEVAYKLDQIMKASKTGGAKKIAELLRLMKKSDYL